MERELQLRATRARSLGDGPEPAEVRERFEREASAWWPSASSASSIMTKSSDEEEAIGSLDLRREVKAGRDDSGADSVLRW